MKLLLLFKLAFFVGLTPGVYVLLYQAEDLMPYLLYGGTAHVVILAVLGFKLEANYAPLAAEVLHKAGFLHTLFALGAAVIVSGHVIGSASFTLESLRLILAPMGAALVPHAVGLTSAQVLAMVHYNPEGEDKAELEALHRLRQRADLLQQQVAVLREEQACYDKIGKALKEVEGAVSLLRPHVVALKEGIHDTDREAQEMRRAMLDCTAAAKDTAEFLKDSKKLHGLIVDLLNSDLFRRAA